MVQKLRTLTMRSIDALKTIYLRQFKSNLKKSDIRLNYGGFALIEFLLSGILKKSKKIYNCA